MKLLTYASAAVLFCLAAPAAAQLEADDPASEDAPEEGEDALDASEGEPADVDLEEESEGGEDLSLEQDTEEGEVLDDPTPPPSDDLEPESEEDATWLLGARYRTIIIPQFLINAFGVDGARDKVTHGLGGEVGYSHESFDLMLGGWWVDYYLPQTPFKGSNDGPEAWELVTSNADMFYLTVDMMVKAPIHDDWAILVGGGAGIGFILGNLSRNEAYWTNGASVNNPGDPYSQLAPCGGFDNPPGTGASGECPPPDGQNNVHYGTGSPWDVFPWLAFQTGVRYSPVKQFVGRLDLGISSSGFFVGLGADYGL